MKWFTLIFAAILFSTLSVRAEPVSVDAITVVDGDTVEVGGYRYRLVGYDTPEIKTRRRKVTADERALAIVAKDRFTELLHSGPLDLVEVVCSCPAKTIGTKKCNYGRKCGILKVNGTDVGVTLITEELAVPSSVARRAALRCPSGRKLSNLNFLLGGRNDRTA